ncbi:pyridoxamine 5'-phosphate oxidase family protein [Natronococcus jeotgali]|uniref:Flavin-nucleotide-binding protein-like protein n=1 Tax=Natronococcus jeotgali DSM 18795 TaxID=1227498 RepID=L9XGH4_9EURY|nr:pyridoxamine 5'-phosphate oxidase family protein [Natronococcus jeotgali]ELY60834.1 flavin-nucleotide-binding protein-like protein [Natronococcus jeotgali DSM 18795]
MQGLRWVQLSADEMNEFLGRGGIGVLSFGRGADEAPFSIPVSYGYNPDEAAFYYRLSMTEESEKADLVDRSVSFVAHRETDEGWRSVVADGRLAEIEDSPFEPGDLHGMWAIEIPIVDIFERPLRDVSFRFFRLEPEAMTGRKEVRTDP